MAEEAKSKSVLREQIEQRLQLHILTLCLASVGKHDGGIKACKERLHEEVARLVCDETASLRAEVVRLNAVIAGEQEARWKCEEALRLFAEVED